jgi:hypothetical protein
MYASLDLCGLPGLLQHAAQASLRTSNSVGPLKLQLQLLLVVLLVVVVVVLLLLLLLLLLLVVVAANIRGSGCRFSGPVAQGVGPTP